MDIYLNTFYIYGNNNRFNKTFYPEFHSVQKLDSDRNYIFSTINEFGLTTSVKIEDGIELNSDEKLIKAVEKMNDIVFKNIMKIIFGYFEYLENNNIADKMFDNITLDLINANKLWHIDLNFYEAKTIKNFKQLINYPDDLYIKNESVYTYKVVNGLGYKRGIK